MSDPFTVRSSLDRPGAYEVAATTGDAPFTPIGFVRKTGRQWVARLYRGSETLPLGLFPTRRDAAAEVWIHRHDRHATQGDHQP